MDLVVYGLALVVIVATDQWWQRRRKGDRDA